MRFNYKFAHLCGVAYQGGSLCFSSDGSTLLSPVGQRVTAFHLLQHRSTTFPFTLPSNVEHVALSPSNQLLVVVDDAGRAVFVHYPSHTLLFEFSFQAPVTAIAFSPQSAYLAVAVGPVLHIYPTPSLTPSYRPLHLHRRMQLHSAAIRCLAWSADGMYIISGGEDGAAKVVTMGEVGEGWEVLTLAGHREGVVGAWWGGGTAVGEEGGGAVRVYTVSKEGALLQWRWKADADDSESVRQLRTNRRALAAASSSSSHVQRPPAALTAVRLFGVTGRFALSSKHFFSSNSRQSSVSCCQLHHTQHGVDLLLVAFSSGSFSLYDLPSFTLIHSLSVSNSSLSSLSISPSGAWLACGSRASGSLLVWEWQSESYVLKQQGHSATVSSLSYSPDSQYVVTGGDDGRVKLWHGLHGFCFKTFAHHTAPVTAVLFSSNGNVVFSASLDGTVHAYDLVRYRLFRTFTTPTPAQFSCLALDPLGELLMAGTADPFDVFVFAVQTGRLLDVLSGHEGPISGLAFSPQLSLLLSSSWDRSVRLWDPFEGKGCVERLQHDSDVLSLAVAPDGLTLATALLNGTLQLWDIRTATLTGSIEVGKDIAGGRARDDVRTVKSRGGGYVTSMCWSADGSCLLVGGNSRFVCIYDAQRRLLVKRFTLSSNERMDGVKDRLNSRYVNDPRAHMDEDDDDAQARGGVMPGARTGERSARRFSLRMRSRCVRFAPTGLQWAAATTEGLLTFALHDELTFDPTDIAVDVTPASIDAALHAQRYSAALLLALRLNEEEHIHRVLHATPHAHIHSVVDATPHNRVDRLLSSLASELESSGCVELFLSWLHATLLRHRALLSAELSTFLPLLRRVGRIIGRVRGEVGRVSEDSLYLLEALHDAAEQAEEAQHTSPEQRQRDDEQQAAKLESHPALGLSHASPSPARPPQQTKLSASKRRKPAANSHSSGSGTGAAEEMKSTAIG